MWHADDTENPYLTERLELEELPEDTTAGRAVSSARTSLFDKTKNHTNTGELQHSALGCCTLEQIALLIVQ